MQYQTYPPSPHLAPLVKYFWSLEFPATQQPEKQTIIPDGCMELIINYGDIYQQFSEDGSSTLQPRSFVFGQLNTILEIAPTGTTGMIAARFHPTGFFPLTDLPLLEMSNKPIALAEVFGKEGIFLEEKVLTAKTQSERIRHIETFLLTRLNKLEEVDQLVKSSTEILICQAGRVKIEEIAGQLNINRRKLERKFSTVVGISPKQLSKIIRLQATLVQLKYNPELSLTDLAYLNGYFDQSHFIKDFKAFTGISPKQFYAAQLQFSTLFIRAK